MSERAAAEKIAEATGQGVTTVRKWRERKAQLDDSTVAASMIDDFVTRDLGKKLAGCEPEMAITIACDLLRTAFGRVVGR